MYLIKYFTESDGWEVVDERNKSTSQWVFNSYMISNGLWPIDEFIEFL